MRISEGIAQNIYSLRQAIGVANMQKAMNQDQQAIDSLVKGMEQSVTPNKGANIDIKL